MKVNVRKAEKDKAGAVPFLADITDLNDVAEEILLHCTRKLGAKSGSLFIAHPEKPLLHLLKTYGPRDNYHIGESLRIGEGVSGSAAARRKPVRSGDILSGTRVCPRKGEEEASQFLSLPILHDSQLLAVLNISMFEAGNSLANHETLDLVCTEVAAGLRRVLNEAGFFLSRNGHDPIPLNLDNAETRLLGCLPQIALLFDPALRVTFCNKKEELDALFGRKDTLERINRDILKLPLEIDPKALERKLEELRRRNEGFTLDNVRILGIPEHQVVNVFFGPIHGADTLFCGGIAIINDNTANFKVQQRLIEAERLSLVGSLTSMITHEINNPLDGVIRLVKMARTNVSGIETAEEYLGQALQGLSRMSSLVKSLLGLSRRNTQFEAELVPLDAIIRNAIAFSQCRNGEKRIRFELENKAERVQVNANDFYQILANLLTNAFDAVGPDSGVIAVRSSLERERLHIEIEDNGCGMTAAVQERIFDAFWTTKEYGKGTGLGLAIVKKIVERHEGRIQVESAANAGAKFHITFPADKLI